VARGVWNVACVKLRLTGHAHKLLPHFHSATILAARYFEIFEIRIFRLAMADTKHKFCSRCRSRHGPPTGKKKCKRPIDTVTMDALDDLAEVPLELEMPVVNQPSARSDRSTDEKIDALVNVVSDLVSRVDATQRQLYSLQLAAATAVSTDR
jgi:hypothetical protein